MSVVGIDFGNLNSYIGVARQGGIDVIANDYSLRETPSCVAFGPKSRSMGVSARQQVNTNFKNTLINFKHLIGRKFNDPIVQKFRPYIPCELVELSDGHVGFKVNHLGKEGTQTPEQVLGAFLTKMRDTVAANSEKGTKVHDIVLAVPSHFTDVQRRAVLAGVQTAQLNPLRLINESTAIALAYGIYKQDLPAETEKPRIVAFLDCGHSSTQASLVSYHKGKLQMLGTAFDLDVGGLWFDGLLRDHFRKEFSDKYKIDASKNPRAWLRLLDECEKVKKQMSANATPIPLNIECFMEDKDVSGSMKREQFEEVAMPLFEKIQALLLRLLSDAQVKREDVESVEIVGGSSRIPYIRKIVHNVFGQDPKTTMNQDEAVSRGAAMQCAILSPAFRVRDFQIKDCQPYSIRLNWGEANGVEGGESDVFKDHDEFPFSKMLSFYRSEQFELNAGYAFPNTIPHTARHIGSWVVHGVTPSAEGGASKVKVKVRVNPNGIFSVPSATLYRPAPAEEPMETDSKEAKDEPMEKEEEKLESKPKPKMVPIELKIEERATTYPIDNFIGFENEMRAADLAEKEKADAKNAVEEYVYEMREKLSSQLESFIDEKSADAFKSHLQEIEDWLYEDGEDAETKVYKDRLGHMKSIGDPIVERHHEAEGRQPAFDKFDQSIIRARKAYDNYVAGGPDHAHVESKDMTKVITAIEDKKNWLDDARRRTEKRPRTEPPLVYVSEINAEHKAFENVVNPILNKPKPTPKKEEVPKEAPPPAPEADAAPKDMEVD